MSASFPCLNSNLFNGASVAMLILMFRPWNSAKVPLILPTVFVFAAMQHSVIAPTGHQHTGHWHLFAHLFLGKRTLPGQ